MPLDPKGSDATVRGIFGAVRGRVVVAADRVLGRVRLRAESPPPQAPPAATGMLAIVVVESLNLLTAALGLRPSDDSRVNHDDSA